MAGAAAVLEVIMYYLPSRSMRTTHSARAIFYQNALQHAISTSIYSLTHTSVYVYLCTYTQNTHTHTHSIKWNDYACLKSNAHCVISTPKYAAVPYYYSQKTISYVRTHMSIQEVTHETHIIMLTMYYYTSLFVRVLDFCELRVEFCISWHMVAVEAAMAFRQTRKCFLQLNHRYYKIKILQSPWS